MKKLPPVSEICLAILILVVVGGIILAAHLPQHTSLAPTTTLISIAGGLVLVNIYLLSRISHFSWSLFFLVAKWTLMAYVLIAGTLEYIFVHDGVRGNVLALMSSTLIIFAVNLPIHFGFTVARYSPPAN